MRRWCRSIAATWVVVAASACGSSTPPPRSPAAALPPLPPAPRADPDALGAAYLHQVAPLLRHWEQFLEDCRLRLAADHPLNNLALAATAELVIERDGAVQLAALGTSGDADFDDAAREVIAELDRLPPPPVALLSDDDRAHLVWLFARDRRRAGAGTASVRRVELPLGEVIDGQLARGELDRAARRIARAPATDPMRATATERVMVAVLREALRGADVTTRALAVEAIGRTRATALADEVRALLSPTVDTDSRLAAIEALAALGDRPAVPLLASSLPGDLIHQPRLALAEAAALARLGEHAVVTTAVTRAIAVEASAATALHAHVYAPDRALAARIALRFRRGDAGMRVAACAAIPAGWPVHPIVSRGLDDRDASVRAACVAALDRIGPARVDRPTLRRLRALATDRDHAVRARAIGVLAVVDRGGRIRIDDPDPAVRAAAARGATADELRALARDPDPDVRAGALERLGARAGTLLVAAASDPSAAVRRVAARVATDDATLERLAVDHSPEVASEALVQLVRRRGPVAMVVPLLGQLVAAPAGSAERVRVALAWLLAHRAEPS